MTVPFLTRREKYLGERIINYLKQPKFVFDVDSRTKQKLFVTHKYVGSSLPDMALKTLPFHQYYGRDKK